MPKLYEHLHLDLTPEAVEYLAEAIDVMFADGPPLTESVRVELRNVASECRARLQHVIAGDPDISQTIPGRSPEEWLNE